MGLEVVVVVAIGAVILGGCGSSGTSKSGSGSRTVSSSSSTSTVVTVTPPPRGTPKINGSSRVSCSCATVGSTLTLVKLTGVSDGNGGTVTRSFQVYRPAGLPTSGQRAPALLLFGGSGGCGATISSPHWQQIAAANHFLVIYDEMPVGHNQDGTTTGCSWEKKWVAGHSSGANTTCGTVGCVPDDEGYVSAVVANIIANQHVDPRRIYAAGASSGAAMVEDIMCDPASSYNNSTKFRGYMVDSSSLQLFPNNPWGGLGGGGGQPNCPATNNHFFFSVALSDHGQDSAFFNDSSSEQHLTVPQLTEYMAHRLRCPAPTREGTLGPTVPGQNKTVRFRVEGPCGSWIARGPAVEGFEVIGGAHEWSCQDSFTPYLGGPCNDRTSPTARLSASGRPLTDGLDLEQQEWDQMAAGVSYR